MNWLSLRFVEVMNPFVGLLFMLLWHQNKHFALPWQRSSIKVLTFGGSKDVLESLCGFQISAIEVSPATKEVNRVVHSWRERPLETPPLVQLDGFTHHSTVFGLGRTSAQRYTRCNWYTVVADHRSRVMHFKSSLRTTRLFKA